MVPEAGDYGATIAPQRVSDLRIEGSGAGRHLAQQRSVA
jgi:hypothetical protein